MNKEEAILEVVKLQRDYISLQERVIQRDKVIALQLKSMNLAIEGYEQMKVKYKLLEENNTKLKEQWEKQLDA